MYSPCCNGVMSTTQNIQLNNIEKLLHSLSLWNKLAEQNSLIDMYNKYVSKYSHESEKLISCGPLSSTASCRPVMSTLAACTSAFSAPWPTQPYQR